MYDELVKELRDSAEWADRLAVLMGRAEGDTHAPIMRKAANAIEELQKRVPKRPHGRLGDLDALIEKVIVKYLEHERKGELVFAAAEVKQDIVDLISDAPTIIQAEEG